MSSQPEEIKKVEVAAVIVEATPPAVADDTVANRPTATNGLCPVKAEYVRTVVQRVGLDGAAPTRGMVKGQDREMEARVVGTEAPKFEGESNFLGPNLSKIKTAVKEGKKMKQSNNQTNSNIHFNDSRGKRDRDDATTTVVTSATTDALASTDVPPTVGVTGGEELHASVGGDEKEEEGVAESTTNTTILVAEKEAGDDVPTLSKEDREAEAARAMQKERAAAVNKLEETAREREERIRHRDKLFRNKSILAPLTTVGNLPFRRVCKDFGVDVTCGEMAMVFNLNQIQKSEWSLLRRHESEDIFGIQLGVAKPEDARIFAKALAASDFQYDYIDINCGCPVDLMVNRGCGCGLYAKKNRLRGVVQELVENQPMPVTIKCRIGDDEINPTLQNHIGDFESWGADAVTVHGRSRRQRYTKLADWKYVERVAKLTSLPVVGNGDILAYDDVAAHRHACPSVSSFMTGRGALIKPWLFEEWNQQIAGGRDISSSERFEMLKKFCTYGLSHWGSDERGVMTTRKFLCEWLSFLCRYVPVGIMERLPQGMNDRPPYFVGRDDLETLMASEASPDWIKITEMLLGPCGDKFNFTAKHKSNSYTMAPDGTAKEAAKGKDDGDQG